MVEQLIAQHGPKRKAWPKGVLKSLQDRNSALLGAICERLCFVPKDLFWPLGVRAKELVVGRQGDSLAGVLGQDCLLQWCPRAILGRGGHLVPCGYNARHGTAKRWA